MNLELDEESIDKDMMIDSVMEWCATNPHLPITNDTAGRDWVYRFLYGCKFNISRTKSVLEMYFRVRQTVPELFTKRTYFDEHLQQNFDVLYYFPLPRHTPAGYRVNVFKLRQTDDKLFDAVQFVRRLFMIADVRLQEEKCLGDIMVFDCSGFTLSHLARFSVTLVRKFLTCAQDALPTRIRRMHFVNSPLFIDRIVLLFKTFMKEKLSKRIFVHTEGYETLHEVIPKAILPKDYEGEEKSMELLNEAWKDKLQKYDVWFQEQERLLSRVQCKLQKTPSVLEFGLQGSFKQLIID